MARWAAGLVVGGGAALPHFTDEDGGVAEWRMAQEYVAEVRTGRWDSEFWGRLLGAGVLERWGS